jgi:hypothetical protein
MGRFRCRRSPRFLAGYGIGLKPIVVIKTMVLAAWISSEVDPLCAVEQRVRERFDDIFAYRWAHSPGLLAGNEHGAASPSRATAYAAIFWGVV